MRRAFHAGYALALALIVWPAATRAEDAKILSLAQALETAHAHAPELGRARADARAALAHVDVVGAPLLPQVLASLGYQRATSNPGAPSLPGNTRSDFATQDNWNAGVTATQLIYDFGRTRSLRDAARATGESAAQGERTAMLQLDANVRFAYFVAGAQKALLAVARETLANQTKHLEQIQAFVEVGTRPEIDLAQVRTDVANSRLAVLRAETGYAKGKAQIQRAIGDGGGPDFDVTDDLLGPLDAEDAPLPILVAEAEKARPELAALAAQLRAQEATIRAAEGEYGPSLSAGMGLNESGHKLDALAWNWSAGLTLSWSIFQGGVTKARIREARASLEGQKAQLAVLVKEITLDLATARIAVQGARDALALADEVVVQAKERLRLAEGRYAAGAGNIIELGDAQIVVRNAEVERAQSDYDLATARAQLLLALGR